jgi:hypothetical protein
MPGALDRFGSFGKKLIRQLQESGLGVQDLFDVTEPADLDLDTSDVVREWGQVRTTTQRESAVASVPIDQEIPDNLYVPRDPPFNRPYAYTVRYFGRDKEGRFTSKEYNLTFSEQVRKGDIIDVAAERFGVGGEYSELSDVFDINVVAAYTRPGEIR